MQNERIYRTMEDVVAGRNRIARAWHYLPDDQPLGRFSARLPRDEDGVTRDYSFIGCTFDWDVRGAFEGCDVDGVSIPDGGPYGLRDYLNQGSIMGEDHGRWGVHRTTYYS